MIRESDDAVAVMDLEMIIMMMATKFCRKSFAFMSVVLWRKWRLE